MTNGKHKERKELGPRDFSWGYSSAGRAPALQAGGQEFDPPYLHQKTKTFYWIVIKTL